MHWLIVLGPALAGGLVFTRAARNSAARLGLVDAADGRRKVQVRPVPVAGGPAVLLAALGALLVAALLSPDLRDAFADDPPRAIALLLAAVVITAVGFVDDVKNLRARYKLLGQLAAVAVLVGGGDFRIEFVSLLGWVVHLGPLAVPFTAFWLLACMNALNLIDGMDGLLGTVGLIALASLAVMAVVIGGPTHVFTAAVALALAGAVAGFLWFNLPPASVYMGDSGSMLIGLAIGALAIPAALKGPAVVALGAPVALLVLPMMDTTAAVIRRKLTGRGLATADRGHLHHVLQRGGLTTRRALLLVAGLGLVASGGALATTALQNDLFALIAVGGVVLTLLTTRLFGNAEWTLVRERVRAAARGLLPRTRDGAAWELSVRLQGTADWGRVWVELTRRADGLGLQSLCLDVNAPALHENYHARWDRRGAAEPDAHLWRLDLPLFGHTVPLGRLQVAGARDGGPMLETLVAVARIVEAVEVEARELTPVAAGPAPRVDPRPADVHVTAAPA